MSKWAKPSAGFLKLNVGAAFSQERRAAAVGCVIRDSAGNFQKGSGGLIGMAPAIAADLWALFYGLKLAWEMENGQMGKKFIVETDSAIALEATLHPDVDFPFATLVELINGLLGEAWESVEVNLVSKDVNTVANAIAIESLDGQGGIAEFNTALASVVAILHEEA